MNSSKFPESGYNLCGGHAGALDVSMFESFPEQFDATQGKFVVVSGIIYAGPNKYVTPQGTKELHHGQIVESLMEQHQRLEEMDNLWWSSISTDEIKYRLGIEDAGMLTFIKRAMKTLEISGESGSYFGKGGQVSRKKTVEIAKHVLGDEVVVVAI